MSRGNSLLSVNVNMLQLPQLRTVARPQCVRSALALPPGHYTITHSLMPVDSCRDPSHREFDRGSGALPRRHVIQNRVQGILQNFVRIRFRDKRAGVHPELVPLLAAAHANPQDFRASTWPHDHDRVNPAGTNQVSQIGDTSKFHEKLAHSRAQRGRIPRYSTSRQFR